jgi:hypothetical protein
MGRFRCGSKFPTMQAVILKRFADAEEDIPSGTPLLLVISHCFPVNGYLLFRGVSPPLHLFS